MIIVSAGMEKSGTAWFFNLTNDLLVASGGDDVREVRREYGLDDILLYHNCNIDGLSAEKISRLTAPCLQGKTFVVKTHKSPGPVVPSLLSQGAMKATYIYRDPRDAVLSAMDHGKKLRDSGQQHTFACFDTLERSVAYVKEWLDIWEQWAALPRVFSVRYEDLLADSAGVMIRLAGFLSLRLPAETIQEILGRYQRENLSKTSAEFLHFNQGVSERFRTVMSRREQAFCAQQFGAYLERMGCPV